MGSPVLNEQMLYLQEALRECQGLALAGQFAAFAIHEINGSLEAIANLNYLVLAAPADPDQVHKYSNLLEEQLKILMAISRQTLSFYHSKETTEAVPIAPLANAALRIHGHKVAAKAIRLQKKLPDHVIVEGHPGAMLQVFSNLIGNALDALPVHGTLHLRARCANKHAHILVADNGHGIPLDIRPRVFEPFFTTKKERGTGLGLAITKAILERHRGQIRLRTSTREGMSGTAFRISVPLHGNN